MATQLRAFIALLFPFIVNGQNIPTSISEINPSSPISNPNDFTCVEDNLFFTATTVINGIEPFQYPLPSHIGVKLIEQNASIDSYPNPTQKDFWIALDVQYADQDYLVVVYDVYGRVVQNIKGNTDKLKLDLPCNPKAYTLSLFS